MGIKNLLPQLRDITKEVHIHSYAGKTVAIDGYSWLHKVAIPCSTELCRGEPTDRYIRLFLSKLALLQRNGVHPLVIFDGGYLPMKAAEEEERKRARQNKLELAERCLARGLDNAAREAYQSAVDVTPQMVKALTDVLQQHRVPFIVAPYEADAQLAYLAIQGMVHAVISEDSDMLVYGCPRVLFKLDGRTGIGQEIVIANLQHNHRPSFRGWDHAQFVQLCILMGCDFLKSPKGIGDKKAYQLMQRLRTFTKVCTTLRRFERSIQLPPGYEACFQRAIWTFRHQRVYCPKQRRVVHLTAIPEGGLAEGVDVPEALPGPEDEALAFLGGPLPDAIARGIADATLDPFTHEPLRPAPLPPSHPHPAAATRPQSAPAPQSRTPWTIAAAGAGAGAAPPRTFVLPVCYAHGRAATPSPAEDGGCDDSKATGAAPSGAASQQAAASSGSAPTVLHALSQLEFGSTSQEQSGSVVAGSAAAEDPVTATQRSGAVDEAASGKASQKASQKASPASSIGRFFKQAFRQADDGSHLRSLLHGRAKENTPPSAGELFEGKPAKALKRRRVGAPVNQQFKQPWKEHAMGGPFAKFVCKPVQERESS